MFNFAERLKSLRTKNNLLQKQIAELIEVSDRQYRNYEAGWRKYRGTGIILNY